jgi:predicted GIY-YIG superfamily endonuclease
MARPAAVVLIFSNSSGLYHIDAAPSYAECVAALSADDSFVRRYGFDRIVYCEQYERYALARARAQQLRQLSGQELERLIDQYNPERLPLHADQVLGLMPIRSSLPSSSRRRTQRSRQILPYSVPPPRTASDD